jgi:endonuclease/exonuclease/phosphatase family metal-dependent hydrolase
MKRLMTIALSIILALVVAAPMASGQSSDTTQSTNVEDLTGSLPATLAAAPDRPTDSPHITVMTRNLYLGADLDQAILAIFSGDQEAITEAATAVWASVVATNFPERAEVLAKEIAQSQPHLVGLQEVSLYRTGPPDTFSDNPTPARRVRLDYLEILLQELNEQGLHYAPVAVTKYFDVENPGDIDLGVEQNIQDIRLTDRDVILARTDLPTSQLKLSNVQTANFHTNASLPIGDTGQFVTISRGWGSVDVTSGGHKFRFINTHLEQEGPFSDHPFNQVQVAQGNEILSGPANTSLPVILVGDYNSRADGAGTPTYSNLTGAGLTDAWSVTHPGELGNTFGYEPLLNTTVELTQRLDLVLFRGSLSDSLSAVNSDVVGDDPDEDRTPSGLWPSDHAGVVATLRVE